LLFGLVGLVVACTAYSALTVTVTDPSGSCTIPAKDSDAGSLLDDSTQQAGFKVLYPCQLPAGEKLTTAGVTGDPGARSSTLTFGGPFDMTVRQSQVPPALSADPAGSSHLVIDLFPNVKAQLIERNDGSRKAEYHLVWNQGAFFYDVLADGPPLSRDLILKAARSLQ
jgi:hypothetical protein